MRVQAAAPYVTAAKPYAPYVAAGTLAVVTVATSIVLVRSRAAKAA